MGEYRDDWFSFDVKSRRRVMDLIIEPSFAKSVCFQVHEMENDSFKIFWIYGGDTRNLFALVGKYINEHFNEVQDYWHKPAKEFFVNLDRNEKFRAFVKENLPPIQIADLDANDMNLINAVVNAEGPFKEDVCGLDGHSYRIKIYGEEPREFECWCVIPKEWHELIPLVDRLIEIAKLEPLSYYAVHDVY